MKQILHLVSVKIITFKSSYNWSKIGAATSDYITTIYTQYKGGSQGVILDGV